MRSYLFLDSPPVDLPDDSTFKNHDIVPGGTITLRIWQHDGWGHLVAAAAEGNIPKVGFITFVNGERGSFLKKTRKAG